MEIRETTLSFPAIRGSGPQLANATVVYPREVVDAVAGIRGYQVGFSGEDHHVGLMEIDLSTETLGSTVTVRGRLGCRDWSGHWDDDYGGTILVSVLADLVSATEPPPRGDLLITGIEVNQATQYFRSGEHLDQANTRPDNSIPLVSGKTTGLRVYVDYDASSGLPPISNLAGELVVRSGGANSTFAPLAQIQPRAVTEIDRGSVDHTLNFAIPEAWCTGSIDIEVRVFDATTPGQRSTAFRRTLRFVQINPMRVYAVGVNYTGMGLDLAAPTLATFATTFDYAQRVWPTGDLLFSGYSTIEFSQSLAGTASEGCGSGFNSLLDQLRDIKGDTDDLVYGLLPTGTPLTGVGGCGGGGAGSGMESNGVTAAHEAGHAVGRQHAPCDDSGRCDSPQNQDGGYPTYGNYVSDSIGEFGFDPENNRVFDPASSRDFMGYSSTNWISTYTYTALMSLGDPTPSSDSGRAPLVPLSLASVRQLADAGRTSPGDPRSSGQRPEWIRCRERVLFLRVSANGDDVHVHPSFAYEAFRQARGVASDYEVHVLDADEAVIACVPLRYICPNCDHNCGPVDLAAEIPITGDPVLLVVRRDGNDVARCEFESEVRLECSVEVDDDGDLRLVWEGHGSGAKIWYLVQWLDRDGAWRGVAPRTTNTSLVIPSQIRWATKQEILLRVLAVEHLTTTATELKLNGYDEDPPIDITVYDGPGIIGAVGHDPLGRQLPGHEITWFYEDGGAASRGSRILRHGLRSGVVLRAVAVGPGFNSAEGLALAGQPNPPFRPSRPEGIVRHQHPHTRGQ